MEHQKNYLLHTKSSNKIITKRDAIENALYQESMGIEPHYARYDKKNHKQLSPLGWLVWSTYEDGCGIVYRKKQTGENIDTTGCQGEFSCLLRT